MATDVQQMRGTLEDVLNFMAPFAGGSIPPDNDIEYSNWIGWINDYQEDAASRGPWSRLLKPTDLSIVVDEDTAELPDNFHKRNGIYSLMVNGVDWSEGNNEDKQRLFVNQNATTGKWQVNFVGFTPTESVTAKLWYFFLPPKVSDLEDILFLDGKMIGYGALIEYFRQAGELGSLDDTRAEYNNRFSELLALEVIPTKQELLSWQSYPHYLKQSSNERHFYTGRSRRTRTR